MADYCGICTCRNPFRIKNPDAFEAELRRLRMRPESEDSMAELYFHRDGDAFEIYGYGSLSVWDDKIGDTVQLEQVIQPRLKEGEVVVLREVGYTKCRYDGGGAFVLVIRPSGTKVIDLYRLTEDELKVATPAKVLEELKKVYAEYQQSNNPHDFDRFIRACERMLV